MAASICGGHEERDDSVPDHLVLEKQPETKEDVRYSLIEGLLCDASCGLGDG